MNIIDYPLLRFQHQFWSKLHKTQELYTQLHVESHHPIPSAEGFVGGKQLVNLSSFFGIFPIYKKSVQIKTKLLYGKKLPKIGHFHELQEHHRICDNSTNSRQ